jgi:hypothetical protein
VADDEDAKAAFFDHWKIAHFDGQREDSHG